MTNATQMTLEKFSALVAEHEQQRLIMNVDIGGKVLSYATPNSNCLSRAKTLMTKEPVTIAWLDSLPQGGTLLDVGANVGMYTVYAGVMREAHVFAFEPEAGNYAVLCENIINNRISDRAIAWCASLSDSEKFDRLYISTRQTGASCHSFGTQVNAHLQPVKFPASQGSFSTTIDALVASATITVPDFIKIDVDGIEHKIVQGALKTCADQRVRSLLIEINSHLAEHREIVAQLERLGFNHDPGQFAASQRKDGFFAGVGEYVFRR